MFWRKKKIEHTPPRPALPAPELARPPMKPALPGLEPTLEERTLGIVAECTHGARLEGDSIRFPDSGLRLHIAFPDVDGPNFRMVARLEHPDFFGPLVETAAGYSEKDKQKARIASYEILNCVLAVLLPALKGEGEAMPPVCLWGRTHRFRACVSNLLLRGAKEPPDNQDLWSRMKEAILPYLGSKSVYWIRLYMSNTGEGPSCEVRINGRLVPELTADLTARARAWPLEGVPMKSAKQYAVLVQERETRVSCPYTWEEAQDVTRKAIQLYESGMESERLPEAVDSLTAVPSLAEDVINFMPELMTKALLPEAKLDSRFTLLSNGGGEPVEVRFTQCRSWDPIYAAVDAHLREDNPSRDKLMTIVGASAMTHALRSALHSGSEVKDLVLCQSFAISDGYQLW